MSYRNVDEFHAGSPILSRSKDQIIKQWYGQALDDMVRATDPAEKSYFIGNVVAMQSILELVYDLPITDHSVDN